MGNEQKFICGNCNHPASAISEFCDLCGAPLTASSLGPAASQKQVVGNGKRTNPSSSYRPTTTIPTRKVLTIGRGPNNDIVLNRPRVSWTHAELVNEKGVWTLTDQGSVHGTAVGTPDNRITRAVVSLDQVVYLGDFGPDQALSLKELVSGREGKLLEQLALGKVKTLVGRGQECDIVLDHPSVSKRHAEITREGSQIYVRDLGSLNGTFIGGKQISGRIQVPSNAVITLGIFTLAITSGGTVEKAAYHGDFILSVESLAVQVKNRRLIEDVSFTFLPQELIAVMGGSGAGKTTLLKALCGYTRPASGQILYNGRDLYANYAQFRHLIGYVPQDDIMHSELKVQEALLFAVMLRTGQDKVSAMKDVENVLQKLELWDIRDSLIGSPINKVISGGQRKRVNIAMELLCRPSCLFLDEPTSGLSSHDAEMVVDVLRGLAKEGKTVVMTIHQPSRHIFEMLSALVVVKRDRSETSWVPGRRVYFGPAYPDSLEFFNPEKFKNLRSNGSLPGPELLFDKLDNKSAQDWERQYSQSKYKTKYVDERRDKELEAAGTAPTPRRRPLWQAWLLVKRNIYVKLRDPMQRLLYILQPLLFGALLAILFHGLNGHKLNGIEDLQDFTTSLATIHFLLAVAAVWFGCNNAIREIVSELHIYVRERMACLAMRNYVLSKLIFLSALCLLQCLLMLGIVYPVCGLKGSFLFYLGMAWLTSLVGVAMGLSISALAAWKKAPEAAVAALPLILLPIILLGGGVYPLHKLESRTIAGVPVARFLSPLAPTRWMFEADLMQESVGQGKFDNIKLPGICSSIFQEYQDKDGPDTLKKAYEVCGEREPANRLVAKYHFPSDRRLDEHARRSTILSLSWLGGLFTAFLTLTFLFLLRLEKEELGSEASKPKAAA